jgi:hypothetical protein
MLTDQMLSSLIRESFESELRHRVDATLDRQLAVFLAMQWVPARAVLLAA